MVFQVVFLLVLSGSSADPGNFKDIEKDIILGITEQINLIEIT